jgi:hypothetical protein
MKFTKRAIISLQPDPSRDLYVWDDELPGFGLRIKPTGVRSFMPSALARGKADIDPAVHAGRTHHSPSSLSRDNLWAVGAPYIRAR